MEQIRPEILLAVLAAVLLLGMLVGRLVKKSKTAPAPSEATTVRMTPSAAPGTPAPSAPAQSYAAVAAAFAAANPRPATSEPVAKTRIDYSREVAVVAANASYAAIAVTSAARA